jgi:hypothetical protein
MSLRDECTEINPDWPQSGDLMVSDTHTALVFARYEPGERHPFANRADVPVFPGPEAAAAQLNQTKYFRDQAGTLVGPPRPEVRFDYLNHRGQGNPVKQKAELIYYASVSDPVFKAFTFRRYTDAVLDPWLRWTGIDNPWEATMANPFLPP